MVKKHIKQLSFVLILLCHFIFLAAILFEKQNNIYISGFIVLVFALLIFTYKKTSLKAKNHDLEHFLTVAYVFLGAVITYGLSSFLGLSNVLSASLVGLTASFIPSLFKSKFIKTMPPAIYCGAFVGMTDISIAKDYIFISIASIITGLMMISTKDTFHGYGGKLGTLAFGGVTFTFFIIYMISQWV